MQGKKPKKTRKKHVFFPKKTQNEKNGFFHNPIPTPCLDSGLVVLVGALP